VQLRERATHTERDARDNAMSSYVLATEWHFEAPIEPIWAALYAVEEWPRWWKYVLKVEDAAAGDADGVGAVRRYTWGSRLPYRLSFNMCSTVVQRPLVLAGDG
jgi:uncharacterized protein YndB with AHSA1/START domain